MKGKSRGRLPYVQLHTTWCEGKQLTGRHHDNECLSASSPIDQAISATARRLAHVTHQNQLGMATAHDGP